MEIFFSNDIQGALLTLPPEESSHCMRVLRHRPGDTINVIDGLGTLYHCTLLGGDAHGAEARIDSAEPGWHSHPYRLTLAVCPTKNPDRYEWMAEKATEVGLDTLVPVIGDRSERKVLGKEERLAKILLSAAKQSLKGAVPQLAAPVSVRDFIADCQSRPTPSLRLIAYCSDEVQPRASIMTLLREFWRSVAVEAIPTAPEATPALPEVIVLIGPEGDFSPEEVRAAMAAGFVPVSLGSSRLRTETAAVTAAEAVYLSLL